MHKSLAMLANVVDYEDKKLQLEGLKNRLEAMASPRLVQAFTAANLGNIKSGEPLARIDRTIYPLVVRTPFRYRYRSVCRTIQGLRGHLQ